MDELYHLLLTAMHHLKQNICLGPVVLTKSYLISYQNIPLLPKLATVDSVVCNIGSRLIMLH